MSLPSIAAAEGAEHALGTVSTDSNSIACEFKPQCSGGTTIASNSTEYSYVCISASNTPVQSPISLKIGGFVLSMNATTKNSAIIYGNAVSYCFDTFWRDAAFTLSSPSFVENVSGARVLRSLWWLNFAMNISVNSSNWCGAAQYLSSGSVRFTIDMVLQDLSPFGVGDESGGGCVPEAQNSTSFSGNES